MRVNLLCRGPAFEFLSQHYVRARPLLLVKCNAYSRCVSYRIEL
jgi:hypothetical protein